MRYWAIGYDQGCRLNAAFDDALPDRAGWARRAFAREAQQRLFFLRDFLDERFPLRNFLVDLRTVLLGRGLDRVGTSPAHDFLHLWIVGHLEQDLRQLADDRLRSLRRGHDAVPRLHNKTGKDCLTYGGEIRQVGAAFERGHGEAAHRSGLDLRQTLGHVGESEIDLAGDHRGGRRRTALERNVHHLDAGAGLEHLDRVVGQAAGAAGAVVELAGVGLGIGHELSQRLRRQVLLDDDDLRDRADDADGREVPQRIVAHLLVRIEGRDRNGTDAADAERIAVACRIRDDLRTHDAAGARAIVDDHRLATPSRRNARSGGQPSPYTRQLRRARRT